MKDDIEFQRVAEEQEKENARLNVRNLIMKYFIYWKWFVISIIICLIAAYFKLKYTTPIYQVSATIMVQDAQKGDFTTQMQSLQDFGFVQATTNIDNEVEVLTSKSLIKQTIIDLKLYTNYVMKGRIGSNILYKQSPVTAEMSRDDVLNMKSSFALTISVNEDSTYQLTYYVLENENSNDLVKVEENITTWPYLVKSYIGDIVLSRNDEIAFTSGELSIMFIPPLKMAMSYLSSLSVTPTSKFTSVAYVTFRDASRSRGVDFVNQLVANYNLNANNDKNIVAYKTEEFINERIKEVDRELGWTEKGIEEFKKNAGFTDLKSDAELIVQESSTYRKKLTEVETQLNLLNYLREYVNNPQNVNEIIPSNVGLTDASLSNLIIEYNKYMIERNNLMLTSTKENPVVVTVDSYIKQLSVSIKSSIETLYKSILISKEDIEAQVNRYSYRIGSAPTQEREFAQISRKQEVQSGLYLMLLQKREENSLVLAATADNVKIIDDAIAYDVPVSPKRLQIWLIALFIGFVLPIVIIYILELLRYKIEGRNDLELLSKVPVLGDVSLSHSIKKGERAIVVIKNTNDVMAETFRSIRTNMQFTLSEDFKKIILFTSTTSGEGKTFVSSNMAVSIALLGKTVLLVGLDIRKPRLAQMFGLRDKRKGITNFLAGDPNDKELLFRQITQTDYENLDILPSGVIPPNPAELLSKVNLDKAMEYLSEKYDYVILDTAPVGVVTDTFIISRVASATIFVCRADYTNKSDIISLNRIKESGQLPNMSLVLNGVDLKKKKYGYYYGYGNYGYGRYGYGYGRYGNGTYGYGRYGYGYGNEGYNEKDNVYGDIDDSDDDKNEE